jgi:hypothetical protein
MVSFTSFRVARRPELLRIDPHKPTYQYLLSAGLVFCPGLAEAISTSKGLESFFYEIFQLLLDLSTPEDSYALSGIWANSKSLLLTRSSRADRVGQQATQRTASTGMSGRIPISSEELL